MSSNVDAPWTTDADVLDLTDTDLTASRNHEMGVSDSSRELHQLVATLTEVQGLDSWSTTLDRATRIEVAHAIDTFDVTFSRSDYDVAYTIPPMDWVSSMETYEDVSLVDLETVEDEPRVINFSTPPVVADMVREAVEQQAYETQSELVETGVRRQLGRLD